MHNCFCQTINSDDEDLTTINYQSDFVLNVTLPDIGGGDFRLSFYVNENAPYSASRTNGILSNNIHDLGNNMFAVVFRNHGLETGRLKAKAWYWFENPLSPDGIMQEVVPDMASVVLTTGKSTEHDMTADVSLLSPIIAQTLYKEAVKNGYTGTEEEYYGFISGATQIKEIGNLTLEIYTAYPTSYRSYSIPQFELAKKPSSDESYYYYYSGEGVGVFDELSTASDEHAEVATASADEEQTESSEEQTDLQTESGAEEGESV